jgi:hypothetical protein
VSGARSADLGQAAWFSPLVLEGRQRPRYVYRRRPINESDSGWAFIEGSEEEAWLNEPGAKNVRMQHLGHVLEAWPGLADVIRDPRIESAWEWDEGAGTYREI